MQLLRDNAQAVSKAPQAQEVIVSALGAGLGCLAKGDLSWYVDEVFPAEYDALRQNFNVALDELGGSVTL